MQNIPIVEIVEMPKHSYFEWFLLGFYELERKGVISLQLHLDWVRTVAKYTSTRYINGVLKRTFRKTEGYNCIGYVHYKDKHWKFCIDCADAPTLYDSKLLNETVCYFKMQCPKEFNEKGFTIFGNQIAPWLDCREQDGTPLYGPWYAQQNHLFPNLHKIRPLMVGPRMLSWGISYRILKKSYENYVKNKSNPATKKMMSYFGNALGSRPHNVDGVLYYDYTEMSCFGDHFSAPNEKRKIASDIMQKLGDAYDPRVISEGQPSDPPTHPEKIIPRDEFCEHISHFEYNLNISGFLLSIPNRFIESFMVGTAIITDQLSIKWYKPFGCEVFETIPMGYLPNEAVDWKQFEYDITHLPTVNKNDILHEFDTKWRPDIVAKYILDEVIAAGE